MRRRSAVALVLAILPLASCVTPKDPDDIPKKVVGPQSDTSQIPWNTPVAGQGGGILSAMPKTPRR